MWVGVWSLEDLGQHGALGRIHIRILVQGIIRRVGHSTGRAHGCLRVRSDEFGQSLQGHGLDLVDGDGVVVERLCEQVSAQPRRDVFGFVEV